MQRRLRRSRSAGERGAYGLPLTVAPLYERAYLALGHVGGGGAEPRRGERGAHGLPATVAPFDK